MSDVFVSEVALRRIFPGWCVPGAVWHNGRIAHGYVPDDMIAIPQHGVNVGFSLLRAGEWIRPESLLDEVERLRKGLVECCDLAGSMLANLDRNVTAKASRIAELRAIAGEDGR